MKIRPNVGTALAAAGLFSLLASGCSAEKIESDPQRAAIESSIRAFIDDYNNVDVTNLKARVCGPLAEDYRPIITSSDLKKVVDSGIALHGKTTLGTITTTSATDTTATANAQVVYQKGSSETPDPTLAKVEVQKLDGQWKVCRFDRDTQPTSTSPRQSG